MPYAWMFQIQIQIQVQIYLCMYVCVYSPHRDVVWHRRRVALFEVEELVVAAVARVEEKVLVAGLAVVEALVGPKIALGINYEHLRKKVASSKKQKKTPRDNWSIPPYRGQRWRASETLSMRWNDFFKKREKMISSVRLAVL